MPTVRFETMPGKQGQMDWGFFEDHLVYEDRDRTVRYVRRQWDALNHIQRVCTRLRLGRDVADLPRD